MKHSVEEKLVNIYKTLESPKQYTFKDPGVRYALLKDANCKRLESILNFFDVSSLRLPQHITLMRAKSKYVRNFAYEAMKNKYGRKNKGV